MPRLFPAHRSHRRALSAAVATVLPLVLAAPVLAEGGHAHGHSHGTDASRQADAHEHGVSALNIAIDGNVLMMELEAPGADIVGFEYEAETDEDKAKITAAVALLEDPATLFALPAAAGCTLTAAEAHLAGEHDDHGHSHGHAHGDETHSEFHAEYSFTCADPAAVTTIGFGYFDAFPNAEEVEVQIIGPNGAQAFEVERAAPTLALDGLM